MLLTSSPVAACTEDYCQLKSVPPGLFLEEIHIAGAASTEAVIEAADYVLRLELVQENLAHKLLGFQGGNFWPKGEPGHLLDSAGLNELNASREGS